MAEHPNSAYGMTRLVIHRTNTSVPKLGYIVTSHPLSHAGHLGDLDLERQVLVNLPETYRLRLRNVT